MGIAASTTQAVRSWERYDTLKTASGANVNDELALVTKEQVNSAFFGALLDTAFALVDLYGPLARLGKAAEGTQVIGKVYELGKARGAVGDALLGIDLVDDAVAKQTVEQGITELGVVEAARRADKSPQELLKIVGEESETGKRIQAFIESTKSGLFEVHALFERLPRLGEEIQAGKITRAEADQLAVTVVERVGPQNTLEMAGGWKNLSAALGNDSQAGARLVAWRDNLMADLEKYVREDLKGGVQRTGTQAFTSDLDISLLGENSAVNREKALSFLAGRAGTTPDGLSRLLYTDLFTDPRRMHLYDLFEPEVRDRLARQSAAFEEELIWNTRLANARNLGNKEMEQSILEQMEQQGIKDIHYTPLSAEDIHRLNEHIDFLHQSLEGIEDPVVKAPIIQEINESQAQINAAQGGGYFSGGGVRRFVSEKEGFPGFTAQELAEEGRRALPAQEFTAVLDQLPKLDEAASHLLEPKNINEIAAAIKSIGKYSERFTSVVKGALGEAIPEAEEFFKIAERAENLIRQARMGAKEAGSLLEQLGRDADAVVKDTQRLLGDMEKASGKILETLKARAELTSLQGGLENIAFLTKAHVKFLRAKDALEWQVMTMARMVRSGIDLGKGDDDDEDDDE